MQKEKVQTQAEPVNNEEQAPATPAAPPPSEQVRNANAAGLGALGHTEPGEGKVGGGGELKEDAY